METAVKTQNKYQVSIDLLNDAVGKEIATSLQYMYFHTHFEDDRYQYLSKIMREISIAEMRHIEEFSDRIMFLQGDVDMNASFRTKQVTDAKEMLRLAMQLEQSTIDSYNEASRIAAEHKDAVTHKMFQLSDVYVMPSVSEPFGISPLEAMRSNVPVIISKQSGVAEVLDYAVKVDYWDVDALADAIYGLIKYPALSGMFASKGLEEVTNLKWNDAAAKIKSVYEAVIEENKKQLK